jgi:uncharacterized protein DUF4292
MKKILFFFGIIILITSCKSTKIANKEIVNLSAKKIIKKNKKVEFDKTSIRANLYVKYRGKSNFPNLKTSLRIAKDSVIWLSFSKLGFPIAKALITPNEIKFYEKISKTYFVGNYELISNWLGTSFDFEMIQNLFFGEALVDLNNEKFKASIQDGTYVLTPKKQNSFFEIFFWIDPYTFKLSKEEINHGGKDQKLTIIYKDFNKFNESLFPKGFVIKAVDKKRKTNIDVNYKNVIFDSSLRFPFKIPHGYSNTELK